jgi:hypothetical protein
MQRGPYFGSVQLDVGVLRQLGCGGGESEERGREVRQGGQEDGLVLLTVAVTSCFRTKLNGW